MDRCQNEGTRSQPCRDYLKISLSVPCIFSQHKRATAAWSEAFPVASVSDLLSLDELRIVVALATSATIYKNAECHVDVVEELITWNPWTLLPQKCRPLPQILYLAINSIIKRPLTRINIPSAIKPVGLIVDTYTIRDLGPWFEGRRLAWHGILS